MPVKVPRLVPHIDVRTFKLDATDGFILTRIDGKLGPKEIARDTGLPDFSVDRALEKLEKLGVIELIDPSAPAAAPPPPAAPARPGLPEFASALSGPKYDPRELEEPAELPDEVKKRILDLFYRLDDLDHYTLLGIGREIDKKGIKRAYMAYAGQLHPDRYFKKNLGSFKQKMEILFARITEAHDTLVDAERRVDYDGYLTEVATTRGMEAMLERALADAQRTAAASSPSIAPPPASAPPASAPRPTAPSGPSAEELKARREALARRLLGGAPRPTQPSKPPETPSVHRYASTQDAMDALKRRYEDRIESATLAQSRKYLVAAEEALAKNDVVAAASALGIAVKFAPDDAALAMRYQEVKNSADTVLCESYLKQAQYEEKQAHWPEAARSWQKVAKIRADDARAAERTAHCLLRAEESDLHSAAEHAKRAIEIEPENVAYHVTLAEVYLKAGLSASAKRALDQATSLDPKHPALTALQKRVGKS